MQNKSNGLRSQIVESLVSALLKPTANLSPDYTEGSAGKVTPLQLETGTRRISAAAHAPTYLSGRVSFDSRNSYSIYKWG